jgi:putative SOS response-associated peptidase YedK
MCGRFTLHSPANAIADLFGLIGEPSLQSRYNIAPTQPVPIIRILRANPETRQREFVPVRWGLVPAWADDPAIGNRLINARAETVASKPSFREAFRYRRCLVPADGFYEWKKEGGRKQPVYIRGKDGQPFAFAGLWEEWEREGEIVAIEVQGDIGSGDHEGGAGDIDIGGQGVGVVGLVEHIRGRAMLG